MDPNMKVVVFFCQQLDPQQDLNRRSLEQEMGERIRFHPMPCGGRVDALHLLRAVEAGADVVHVLTCPERGCRYQQGNSRAGKRLAYAKRLLGEIGLEPERLNWVSAPPLSPRRIDELVRPLLSQELGFGPSPLGRPGAPSDGENAHESRSEG
jgi:coenzyme F420-reducing hydrogenase delta subunit